MSNGSYELKSVKRTYSESALREGIQRSLRGAAADTVCNMGPEATLDSIIKKISFIYGNVKSYDILMGISTVPIRERRKQSPHLPHA